MKKAAFSTKRLLLAVLGAAALWQAGETQAGDDKGAAVSSQPISFYTQRFVKLPRKENPVTLGSDTSPYDDDEKPAHQVYWDYDVWAGRTEVTQGQRKALVGFWNGGGYEKFGYPAGKPVDASKVLMTGFPECGEDCPADQASWYDAVFLANVLSRMEGREECYAFDQPYAGEAMKVSWSKGEDCTGYRLPTEAEWEYLAGQGKNVYGGIGANVNEFAWHGGNSGGQTHPVCTTEKPENALGLCDMSGNLCEWVYDGYGEYPKGPVMNFAGAFVEGVPGHRILRGGSWFYYPDYLRAGDRYRNVSGYRLGNIGFRLVRTHAPRRKSVFVPTTRSSRQRRCSHVTFLC